MTLQFSAGNALLSKIIMWAFDEPVSHVSVLIGRNVILQSNLMGVSLDWLSNFESSHKIVYTIDFPTQDKDLQSKMVDRLMGTPYDWTGGLYLLLCGIRRRLFGIPLPKRNPWHHASWVDCVDVLDALGLPSPGIDQLDMMTPAMLYRWLTSALPAPAKPSG